MGPRYILALALVCACFVCLIAMPCKSTSDGTSQPQPRLVEDDVTSLPSRSPSLQSKKDDDNGKENIPKYKHNDNDDDDDDDDDLQNVNDIFRAKVSKTMKSALSTNKNRLMSTLTSLPITTYPLFVSLPTFPRWISKDDNDDAGSDNNNDDDSDNNFGLPATIHPQFPPGDSLVADEDQNIIVGEILEQMGKLSHKDGVPMWPAPPANREGVELEPQRYREYLNSLSREELKQLLSTLRKNVPPQVKVIDSAATHRSSDVNDLKMSDVLIG